MGGVRDHEGDVGMLGVGFELREGNNGEGDLEEVCRYALKNVLNTVDKRNLYVQLGCTSEGRWLMSCDVFIRRDATCQCISSGYCFHFR